MLNEYDVAAICHEANRAYCRAGGDESQPHWEEAPQWQRESAVSGVLHHLQHPGSTAADSHACWLEGKTAQGWTYGPVKDPDKKQHPCMVPYHLLPIEQQFKDHLFVSIVRALEPLVDVSIKDPSSLLAP